MWLWLRSDLKQDGAPVGLLHVDGRGTQEAFADGSYFLNAFVTAGYHQDGDLFLDDLLAALVGGIGSL